MKITFFHTVSTLFSIFIFTTVTSSFATGPTAGGPTPPNPTNQKPGGPAAGGQNPFGPCAGDVTKLCSGMKPGQGHIHKCLMEKQAQLSPDCRKLISSQEVIPKSVRDACRNDVRALCKDVRPGQGSFLECLRKNDAKTSAGCKDALKKVPAPKK